MGKQIYNHIGLGKTTLLDSCDYYEESLAIGQTAYLQILE